MKNFKLIGLIALFVTMSTTQIVAQEKVNKAEREAQFKIAKEKLALSPDQEVKFKEMNKKYGAKMKEINQESRKEKIKTLKALKTEKDTEMKILLSQSQYKTYLELQEDRIAKMKERRKEKKKV